MRRPSGCSCGSAGGQHGNPIARTAVARLFGLPPSRARSALALQSVPEGFQRHVRDAVRVPQDAAARLSHGRRDLLNEVKGKSMLALSRDLGVQYKTAFVLAHKMREAMAAEVRRRAIGGEGRKAEIDGGYFGGYVKPANRRENRRDRRMRQNQSGKRKVVVVIRERGGKTLPGVFRNEADALTFIRRSVAPKTELYADEAAPGTRCTPGSRCTGSTIRKPTASDEAQTTRTTPRVSSAGCAAAEIGHHHHVAGPYLIRFAQEAAWREDHRARPTAHRLTGSSGWRCANKPSVDFCGYWQRRHII